MTTGPPLEAAIAALDDAEDALVALEARCCEPGRSPRMKALGATLAEARAHLERVSAEPEAAEATFAQLEDAGAQIGRLQVGCCAPDRLPLYARILEDLTTTQLSLNHELGTGH